MATRQRNRGGKMTSTWRARVKFLGEEHYLGSYPTREEAELVEKAYRDDLEEDFGPAHLRGYNSIEDRRDRGRRQYGR